jgi:large subunit ribosomal protein L9
MDVILKHDVDDLGLRGEVVHVARGYARNFLLPRGLAEVATPALVRELERREAMARRHEAKTTDEARGLAERVEALELRFDVNAGPTGSLFGSVTATNVADRLWDEAKIRVDRRKLSMDTIKRVGRYTVAVELFADVRADLRLVVAPPGQELPTEEELAAEAAEQAEQASPVAAAAEVSAAPASEELAVEEPDSVADWSADDTGGDDGSFEDELGEPTHPA